MWRHRTRRSPHGGSDGLGLRYRVSRAASPPLPPGPRQKLRGASAEGLGLNQPHPASDTSVLAAGRWHPSVERSADAFAHAAQSSISTAPHAPHSIVPAMTDKFLHGKVAMVTGGASGMGRAMALAFASAGADVAIGSLLSASAAGTTEGEVVFLPGQGQLEAAAEELRFTRCAGPCLDPRRDVRHISRLFLRRGRG